MITSSSFAQISARRSVTNVSTIFALFCLATLPPLSAGDRAYSPKLATPANETEPPISVESSIGIESSYIAEGIDVVPGNQWIAGTLDVSMADFTLAVFYGATTADKYDELHLALLYTYVWGQLTFTGGYTYLAYPKTNDPDGHELSLGIEYAAAQWLTFAATTFYDIAAIDGGFLELTATGNFDLVADRIAVNPYALLTFDYGYVSDANDTFNNVQVGVEFPISITEQITLILSAHHTWALGNLRREDLGDVSWAGARIAFSF